MSLILDALKRAERERRTLLPAFAHADPATLSVPARRGRGPLLAVIVMLLVAGLALAWYLVNRQPAPPPAATTPVAAPPAAASPASTPIETPSAVPAATAAATVIPGTEGMLSLDELAPEIVALPDPVETPAPAPVPQATISTAPAKESLAEVEPAPVAAADTAEEAPSAPPPAALTQAVPLRKFREMTPEYRADFPAITIEVHVYDRAVSKRWVMVNGKRYKQGERLVEGPALAEIVAEGLVVEYRGEKLLYPLSR